MVVSGCASAERSSVTRARHRGFTTVDERPGPILDAADDGAGDVIAIDGSLTVPATYPVRSASFDLTVLAGRRRARIVLSGELDLAGTAPLDDSVDLVRRAGVPFTIDCWNLTFADGAGVGALLRAKRLGGTLDGAHGPVRRVFRILGHAGELEPLPATGDVRQVIVTAG